MSKKKREFSPEFLAKMKKPVDNITTEKFHRHSFSVRMPQSYGEKLLKMKSPERTSFMRRCLMKCLDELEEPV